MSPQSGCARGYMSQAANLLASWRCTHFSRPVVCQTNLFENHSHDRVRAMQPISLRRDKYRESRGGYSRVLEINCHDCGDFIALYQKDGPGPLKRLYFDRFIQLKSECRLEETSLREVGDLRCRACRKCIGQPCLYRKERRRAFVLRDGSVVKKVCSIRIASINLRQ